MRKNWEELTKVDSWLAENLMGWHRKDVAHGPPFNEDIEGWHDASGGDLNMACDWPFSWRPTMLFDQAIQVMKKMLEEGFTFRLEKDGDEYSAGFYDSKYDWNSVQRNANPAMAITMAAEGGIRFRIESKQK